jgi:V8-like Glu-specific endopeptidase
MNDSESILEAARKADDQTPPGASFAVETAVDTSAEKLAADCSRMLRVKAVAERLFPETDELSRFYRLKVAGVPGNEISALFSLSYRISDELGLRSCEPDVEIELPNAAPATDGTESSSRRQSGCWVDEKDPADSEWAIKSIKADKAWTVKPGAGGKSEGAGILIGQIDTGVNEHDELNKTALKIVSGANFVEGGFAPPSDPLVKLGPLDNPGHGIGTASVVISRKGGKVTGSAPKAKLMPIRSIRSVIRFTQSTVAQGIDFARRQGCHVITMSLGGLPSFALRAALKRAVDDNIIVLAAAGNCVKFVTFPARYDDCIAIGGSNVSDKTWKGSCRGGAVDVCAPAELIYRATRLDKDGNVTRKHLVNGGQGTSFAVAVTAGVAALWLAHHGRDKLIKSLSSGETLQEKFRKLLRSTARVPSGWDMSDYGSGIVNAEALLKKKISVSAAESVFARFRSQSDSEELAGKVGEMVAAATGMHSDDLGLTSAQRVKFGTELAALALTRASGKNDSGTESGLSDTLGLSAELASSVRGTDSTALRSLVGRDAVAKTAEDSVSVSNIGQPNIIVPDTTLRSVSSPRGGTESTIVAVERSQIEFGKKGTFNSGGGAEMSSVFNERYLRKKKSSRRSRPLMLRSQNVPDARETIIGDDDRQNIRNTESDPWRRICCLDIEGTGNVRGVGTGWFVGPTTVITAGHCVHHSDLGGWASKITVYPGRDGEEKPLGSASSTRFKSVQRWVNFRDRDYDIGVIELDDPDLGTRAGWFGYAALSDSDLRNYAVNVAGYPKDHRWSGHSLLFHAGDVLHVSDRRIYYDTDTNGGNSGGPAFVYPDSGTEPVVVGIHAYGTGGTSSDLGIEANSAPRIIPEVFDLISRWRGAVD